MLLLADYVHHIQKKANIQSPASSSSQVPEGTTVKISVCAGYKFDVEVDLPWDFEDETYKVSLWNNGTMFDKEVTVNSTEISTYTFKDLTTTEKELTLTPKIVDKNGNSKDLNNITVNAKDGRVK